jgi:hypothetical protein
VSQIRFTGAKMMEFKVGMQVKHEKHGEVKILNADGQFLVQVETLDGGDTFYTTRASFGPVKKRKASRARKKRVVHKLDGPVIDALLVRETRAEEPEMFDELETVVQEGELEELENEEAEIAEDAA